MAEGKRKDAWDHTALSIVYNAAAHGVRLSVGKVHPFRRDAGRVPLTRETLHDLKDQWGL